MSDRKQLGEQMALVDRTVRHGSPEDATAEVLAALRLDASLTAAWDESIASLRATLGDEKTAALLARATTTLSAGPAPASHDLTAFDEPEETP